MVEFYHSVNQYFKTIKTKQKQNTQNNPPNQKKKKKHYRAIFFKLWEV